MQLPESIQQKIVADAAAAVAGINNVPEKRQAFHKAVADGIEEIRFMKNYDGTREQFYSDVMAVNKILVEATDDIDSATEHALSKNPNVVYGDSDG
ncbi:hypothetical protein KQ940_01655 [Marinobacterium sp. D7]|uniref:hypothetical protein n=1 Tax=Marinobacterium ramblicola TaxID=2849041 RepID=UPI001C2DD46B|nr:hypothetical protein [Marinobacterium ramblicola]MBV1786757.1 hypothetical protein [Marinobacterium ramblicola]